MNQIHPHTEELLLIIDPQNVYLPNEPWGCPTLPSAAEHICQILDHKLHGPAMFTQFIAPAQPEGCWNQYNEDYKDINCDDYMSEIIAPLQHYPLPVVTKSTYSSLRNPVILEQARRYGRIVLTGVVAECCVLATMMDAIDHGIFVVYLTDCVAGQSEATEQMTAQLAQSFSPIHTLVTNSKDYYHSSF